VKAVWDIEKAWRQATPTREQICINGLWLLKPAQKETESVPADNWGYIKVPGPWPTSRQFNWRRSDESQRHYPHPSWKDTELGTLDFAWCQRDIAVPSEWAGRRIVLQTDYVNASAVVFVDGQRAGEIKSRGGEVDLTALSRPGQKQTLSILVRSPNAAQCFRGLCGDVYLESTSRSERIEDVKLDTSVREWRLSADTALASLNPDREYVLRGEIIDNGNVVKTVRSSSIRASDLRSGRVSFSDPWKPAKL